MRISIATSVAALTLFFSTLAGAADNAPPHNAVPSVSHWMTDGSFPSSNIEHIRINEAEIVKIGDGSFEKGLNMIGGGGFKLFAVTTGNDQGISGWHIFKRSAWNMPVSRQKFEYKRIDDGAIENLGGGKFNTGLQKIEQDHWELVAFTNTKDGGIGFYYFERPVAAH